MNRLSIPWPPLKKHLIIFEQFIVSSRVPVLISHLPWLRYKSPPKLQPVEIREELAAGHQSSIRDSAKKHHEVQHLPLID